MGASARAVSRTNRAHLWSLPNRLTFGRMGLVPLLMITLRWNEPFWNGVGALIFLLGSITDVVDGWLARRHGTVTPLGTFLDPLADKLLVATALIMMIPLGRVEAWVAVVIIGRELVVTGLRGIASTEGRVMEASWLGKRKSFVQYVAITCLILAWKNPVDLIVVGQWILYVAVALALWSMYHYIASYMRDDEKTV
ncbi:MAG: CDP-diacylglycerol--glycerol-3-phosphate 3-phosphatidyltransferase [Deltaproteobacteria bacterium RBG_13_65_10]|nr:MAG: CDP-diacylglycerol--glycerol-3-phosphate 3-phosphatidyltransferase [Deltaproteobacteria bacterium RBG_13_65_10]